MKKITITTKLSLSDYIKVNFYLTYSKTSIKVLLAFFVLALIFIITSVQVFSFLLFFIALSIAPLVTYFTAKSNYKSHEHIRETITYEIDENDIALKGSSFQSSFTWDKIYGVGESKSFFLIYQSKQMANILLKRDFTPEQTIIFKEIVNAQHGIKVKLKKVNTVPSFQRGEKM